MPRRGARAGARAAHRPADVRAVAALSGDLGHAGRSGPGAFAFDDTVDGLPYIGPHRNFPRHLFALGLGRHGVGRAWLAARILLRQIAGEPAKGDELFGFSRNLCSDAVIDGIRTLGIWTVRLGLAAGRRPDLAPAGQTPLP